jgi:hypothetical protein
VEVGDAPRNAPSHQHGHRPASKVKPSARGRTSPFPDPDGGCAQSETVCFRAHFALARRRRGAHSKRNFVLADPSAPGSRQFHFGRTARRSRGRAKCARKQTISLWTHTHTVGVGAAGCDQSETVCFRAHFALARSRRDVRPK